MEVSGIIPEAHSQNILCLSYNPYQHRLFTGSEDNTIKVWDTDTGKCERTLIRHTGWITDLLYCDRYNFLFSCSTDGTIVAWTSLLKFFYEKKLNVPCACLAFDQKKKTLIAGMKHLIYFYRVTKNRLDATSMTLLETLFFVELSGFVKTMLCFDGRLVVGSFDRAITIFESATGRQTLKIPHAHKAAVSVVAYDEDNNRFITGGFDKKIKIWNLDGTTVFDIGGFSDVITGICYNPITKTIWVNANSPKPQVFDPVSGSNLSESVSGFDNPNIGGLQQLSYIPFTGEIIGTSNTIKGIITWRHNPFTAITTFVASGDVIETLCYSLKKHGPQIFSGGADRSIKRWEFNSVDSQLIGHESYNVHTDSVLVSTYHDPLDILITGSSDKTIRIFSYGALPKKFQDSASPSTKYRSPKQSNVNNNSTKVQLPQVQQSEMGTNWLAKISGFDVQYILPGHNDRVTGIVAFQKGDGHFLISVSWDLTIIIWELNRENGHLQKMIVDGHNDYINDVDYSPQRNEFATCSVDGIIEIWNFSTYENVNSLKGHTSEVSKIKWDPFSLSWISASHDQTIRLWDTFGGQLKIIRIHGSVTAMCLDRNFGYVIVGISDLKIRVYDTKRDTIVQENAGHTDVITSIIHLKEFNQYLSTSWDQTIRVWSAPKEDVGVGDMNSNQILNKSRSYTFPQLKATTMEDVPNNHSNDYEYEMDFSSNGKDINKDWLDQQDPFSINSRRALSKMASGTKSNAASLTTIDDVKILSRFKTHNNQKTMQFLRESWRKESPPPQSQSQHSQSLQSTTEEKKQQKGVRFLPVSSSNSSISLPMINNRPGSSGSNRGSSRDRDRDKDREKRDLLKGTFESNLLK